MRFVNDTCPHLIIPKILQSQKVCLFVALYVFSMQVQAQSTKPYLPDRGMMYYGLTFKFNTEKVENENRLLVLVEDRKTNSFEVGLDGGYFIKKNLAVGGLVKYGGSQRMGVDISIQNVRSEVNKAKRSWGVYGTTKLFIPVEENNRFFLFSSFLIGGTFDNALTESVTESLLTRTFVQDRAAQLRFIPGLMVNVVKGFNLEVGQM